MPRRWDIFCTVIDNFGDIGVCWRLSRQLSHEYGQTVRLWVNDLQRFARLESTVKTNLSYQMIQGIEVCFWPNDIATFEQIESAEVVIEAFACQLPENYLRKMQLNNSTVWINLEYLSAEPWVKHYHAIPSLHPSSGLVKTCFFPGFVTGTGGLIREKNYPSQQDAFQRQALLQRLDIPTNCPDSIYISLFCYDQAPIDSLIKHLAQSTVPILLIVPDGKIAQRITQLLDYSYYEIGLQMQLQQLTIFIIPFLDQTDYDRLLYCCDINFVRGEDSFVRAQYAANSFIWNIYPQTDQAHWQKLDAFLDLYTLTMPFDMKNSVRQLWYYWNGRGEIDGKVLLHFFSLTESFKKYNKSWFEQLAKQQHLTSNLVQFVENQL